MIRFVVGEIVIRREDGNDSIQKLIEIMKNSVVKKSGLLEVKLTVAAEKG